MTASDTRPRAYLVANPNKPEAADAFGTLKRIIEERNQLAGADSGLNIETFAAATPERLIVLGGDGTILQVGRMTIPFDTPIAGVNLGKLGYLASFTPEDVEHHFDRVMADPTLVSARMTMNVSVRPPDGPAQEAVAINDCVLHVGPPFRMLVMDVSVDGQTLTTITGDGLIIATPTGSTAHNMSAGGPILEPEVEAIVLAPICPHSLAHRPVVMAPSTVLKIAIQRAYEGSTAMIDGQIGFPCPTGATITITRGSRPFRLIRHPERTSWQALVKKLKWGQGPGTSA